MNEHPSKLLRPVVQGFADAVRATRDLTDLRDGIDKMAAAAIARGVSMAEAHSWRDAVVQQAMETLTSALDGVPGIHDPTPGLAPLLAQARGWLGVEV